MRLFGGRCRDGWALFRGHDSDSKFQGYNHHSRSKRDDDVSQRLRIGMPLKSAERMVNSNPILGEGPGKIKDRCQDCQQMRTPCKSFILVSIIYLTYFLLTQLSKLSVIFSTLSLVMSPS